MEKTMLTTDEFNNTINQNRDNAIIGYKSVTMEANDKKPTPEPTPEEILDKMVYDTDDYGNKLITYDGALMVMQEYAELYHKEKLRGELIAYEIFHGNDPNSSEGWVNDYLKTKG